MVVAALVDSVIRKPLHFSGRFHRRENFMTEKNVRDRCEDPTQELTLRIPCRLARRIENYSQQTGADIDQVVIEALDGFLRAYAKNDR